MVTLTHHTTKYALKNIIKEGFIYPIYDCVWFTTEKDGEMTAGMMMPSEHRARITIEIPNHMVEYFHDIHEEFPHLNLGMLNLITDTSNWFISKGPIPSKYFISTEVMKNDKEWEEYNGSQVE